MDIAAVIGTTVVLLVMVGMAVYAAVTLPPGAQIPVHLGIGGYNNWVSKNVGLVIWPAVGAVIFVITLFTAAGRHTGGKSVPTLILPLVLLILAASQYGATRAALRRSGSQT